MLKLIAREKLSKEGKPTLTGINLPVITWNDFCVAIGLEKRTANRWLANEKFSNAGSRSDLVPFGTRLLTFEIATELWMCQQEAGRLANPGDNQHTTGGGDIVVTTLEDYGISKLGQSETSCPTLSHFPQLLQIATIDLAEMKHGLLFRKEAREKIGGDKKSAEYKSLGKHLPNDDADDRKTDARIGEIQAFQEAAARHENTIPDEGQKGFQPVLGKHLPNTDSDDRKTDARIGEIQAFQEARKAARDKQKTGKPLDEITQRFDSKKELASTLEIGEQTASRILQLHEKAPEPVKEKLRTGDMKGGNGNGNRNFGSAGSKASKPSVGARHTIPQWLGLGHSCRW